VALLVGLSPQQIFSRDDVIALPRVMLSKEACLTSILGQWPRIDHKVARFSAKENEVSKILGLYVNQIFK